MYDMLAYEHGREGTLRPGPYWNGVQRLYTNWRFSLSLNTS